ncbi:MAG: DEAD/DEAH box helicase [Alphaproteobacteria bacterium]|nr:DEAD/DEAH box helicase [Alphaproteobacteria bacterium]
MAVEQNGNAAQAIGKALSALLFLASRCDWATSKDGAGFSGVDAPIGHALAGKTTLSSREMIAAGRLLVKYKKQLEQGKIDISGVKEAVDALTQSGNAGRGAEGGLGRLRRRDVVTGWVGINPAGRIVLATSYNERIVAAIKELIGARFDGESKQWTVDPTQENVLEVQSLAQEFGLEVQPDPGWGRMTPARKVTVADDRLVVHGVNAGKFLRALPKLTGKPAVDETLFGAVQWLSPTSIGIPLRSWVIRDAALWLETTDPDAPNARRLAWAKQVLLHQLEQHYPSAQQRERQVFERAAALSLPEDQIETLRRALPPDLATALMPHQWVGAQAIATRAEILLCDEQGLGKTIEILAGLEAAGAFPAIVLAPATALLNWRDEAARWLPHRRVSVQGGGVAKRDAGTDIAHAEIVVLNYESFSKYAPELKAIKPAALVVDEAQYLKGHDSARTEAVKEFARYNMAPGAKTICATGTPVMNRPAELLTLLTLTPGLLTDLGGFTRFASRYCRATLRQLGRGVFAQSFWDYGGAANLGELANRIREAGGFVRRSKSQVLPGLAAKSRHVIDAELCNRVEYEKARTSLAEWLKTKNKPAKFRQRMKPIQDEESSGLAQIVQWYGWGEDEIEQMRLETHDRAEALRKVGALRQLAGIGKIPSALRWIEEHVKDEKLVIFAYHIDVQNALLQSLEGAGYRALSITGDMTAGARRKAIQEFQADPAAQVIVCSIKAAQTAITLTAARHVLMVELDWTPSALEQAEDRVHRIGQTGAVDVSYLHAPSTLDDRMVELLEIKRSKISVLNAAHAPYGYRKDGQPRLQPPGPGRPRLDPAERAARRKSSKTGWQSQHLEYMRDYMRARRRDKAIKDARRDIRDFEVLERMGVGGYTREFGYNLDVREMYDKDLAEAQRRATKARARLDKLGVDMPTVGSGSAAMSPQQATSA